MTNILLHPSFAKIPLMRGLRLLGLLLMVALIAFAPLLSLPARTYADATPNAGYSDNPSGVDNSQAPVHPTDLCKTGTVSGCISSVIYYLFVETTAIFAYFGGVIFDYVVSIALNSGTYADSLINTGWTIARDLANMAFLFLVVLLGIRLILNIEGVGAGKTLAKILAVALIINFSFFFTRVVIDASNLLAHQFYDHINGRQVSAAAGANGGDILVDKKPLVVKSISENVMGGLNVQQILSSASFQQQTKVGGFFGNLALQTGLYLVFAAINLFLAFIFFIAAIQFVGRIVALWLTIMLAPLGFIAFIIPGSKKYAGVWWNALIKNAFFAPAFLFIFYLLVLFLDNGLLGAGTGKALYTASAGQSTPDAIFRPLISIIIRLVIVFALLKAALKVGTVFGQSSAEAIIKGSARFAGTAASIGLGGVRMMRGAGRVASGMLVTPPGATNTPMFARASTSPLASISRVTAPTQASAPATAPAPASSATIATSSLAASLANATNPLETTVTGGNQPLTRGAAERARRLANTEQAQSVADLNASRPASEQEPQRTVPLTATPAPQRETAAEAVPPAAPAPIPLAAADVTESVSTPAPSQGSAPATPASESPSVATPASERASARLSSAPLANVFSPRNKMSNNEVVSGLRDVANKVEEVREALAPLRALEASASGERTTPASMGTLDRLRTTSLAEGSAVMHRDDVSPDAEALKSLRTAPMHDVLSQLEKAEHGLRAAQNRPAPPQAPAPATATSQPNAPRPSMSGAAAIEPKKEAPRAMQGGDIAISQVERMSRQATREAERVDRDATAALNKLKQGLPPSAPAQAQSTQTPPPKEGGASAEAKEFGPLL